MAPMDTVQRERERETEKRTEFTQHSAQILSSSHSSFFWRNQVKCNKYYEIGEGKGG